MNNEQYYLLRFDCLIPKVSIFWLLVMQNGFSHNSFISWLSERISREKLVPTKFGLIAKNLSWASDQVLPLRFVSSEAEDQEPNNVFGYCEDESHSVIF